MGSASFIPFLKSYGELRKFIQETADTLRFAFGPQTADVEIPLWLFAINKLSNQDRLRLLSNDYLIKLVPQYKNHENKRIQVSEDGYQRILKYSLEKLINSGQQLVVYHSTDKNLIEFKSSKYKFYARTADIKIIELLKSAQQISVEEGLSDSSPLDIFKHYENILLLTDKSYGSCERGEVSPDAIRLGSLYGLLTALYNYQDCEAASYLDQEDKIFFEKNGYFVKENFLSPDQIALISELVYKIAELQNKDGSAYLYGNQNKLQRIYNLIGKSKVFINILLDERLHRILDWVFHRDTLHQKYYLSSFQANILYPGAEAQILHTDLAIPEPLPPWPIRLNLNILIDDFTEDNGSTLVYPGSHKTLKKPKPFDEEVPLKKLIAPAGSLVGWTGHLWHKSGSNTSTMPRAALLACFSGSYMREIAVEENYLQINSQAAIENFPPMLIELIGGNHGLKPSA
jgi:ectoine hydroxylase-related dioxygenase (phytanoyl-CoA dioxygenase family)